MLENFEYSEKLTFTKITKKVDHKVESNMFVNSYNIIELYIDVFNKEKNITKNQRFFAINKSDYENFYFYRVKSARNSLFLPEMNGLLILPKHFGYSHTSSLKSTISFVDKINLANPNNTYNKNDIINKHGCLKFVEINAWEKETWHSYISLYNRTDEEIELLKQFSKRISVIEFSQVFGTSKFILNCDVVYRQSYIDKVFYLGGSKWRNDQWFETTLNIDLLKKSLSYSKEQMIDLLYKGGIKKLFLEKNINI